MQSLALKDKIKCGETSHVQFKLKFTTQNQIAQEIIAFANSGGGEILFGIEDKTGSIVGLTYEELQDYARMLGNTANDSVRPTIYIQTDVAEIEGKLILIAQIAEGRNKPYKDLSGNIWVKQGSDKRRVTENSEILSLFQDSGLYQADEASVSNATIDALSDKALSRFFENVYHKKISEFGVPQGRLLQNLHITDTNGRLTLAGLLFFGENPQQYIPTFVIKAVWFYGNSISGTEYHDSRDIEGTIPEMYDEGLRWLKSCLWREQKGQSINSIGQLEIPELVLEELLQNALVHIDLLKPAAIRIYVFEDRIEIVNPGCLAGRQTVEQVKLGNSFSRNPHLANFCAKTMPYRGLGSGIPRALSADNNIELIDDKEGNQFTAIVYRKPTSNGEEAVKSREENAKGGEEIAESREENAKSRDESPKSRDEIIEIIRREPTITQKRIAAILNITEKAVEKQIKNLRDAGIIRHEGAKKKGYWVILV